MSHEESEGPLVRLSVRRWAACAAGIKGAQNWAAWSRAPWLPIGEETPPLAGMAPMLRRRLDRLGRIALQAAWDCQGDDLGIPIVFASRYGDAARSLALIEEFAAGQDVSPTGFNMSVHNAIGALYAIARGDCANTVNIAAGRASAAAGFIEAAALVADAAPEVMLVCYDDTLPEPYEVFRDEPPCAWAWAWRLAPARGDEDAITLSSEGGVAALQSEGALPAGLDLLRFWLAGDAELTQVLEGCRLHWAREAGHA
jgi:hypothetical protein